MISGQAKHAFKPSSIFRLLSGPARTPRHASTLVVCGHKESAYDPSLLNTVTAAKALGNDVSVLLVGEGSTAASEQVAKVDGVSTVLVHDSSDLDGRVAENVTNVVESLQSSKSFSHILFSATNEGKNIMPRVSAKLDGVAISDVLKVNSAEEFVRPMYAGNAIATVTASHSPKIMTIRSTAFEKADATSGSATVESITDSVQAESFKNTEYVSEEVEKSDRPEITAADIVIAGGRALKSAENFDILYKMADAFPQGAAVGASRAAVDAGYAANDLQIGQTGKVCAPNLYFAVGISGAIQHLAGMKDSKCIVAINKDKEAPIFQVSDYGLEADLFDAVPEITDKLSK